MNPQSRMAKTLACLVASMTIGAALLDWFDPVRADRSSPAVPLIAQLREAIDQPDADAPIGTCWHAIHVDPQQGDPESGLQAVHVIVGSDGQWSLTNNWSHQRQIGEEGVVRIGLRVKAPSNTVSRAQWQETVEIIRNLQQLCQISGQQVLLSDMLKIRPAAPSAPVAQ